jgi:hypothetical protein
MSKQVALWERVSGRGKTQRIRQIPNLYATVDDIDYPAVDQHLWRVLWETRANGQRVVTAVVASAPGRQTVYLHHFILSLQGVPKPRHPLTVDHIDRNPFNNTRVNLRIATHSEQKTNQGKKTRNNRGTVPTSTYKGVSWHRQRQKWGAATRIGSTTYCLGLFSSEQEAAHAVNLFYAAHHPTAPIPNPSVAIISSLTHCSCKLCKPKFVST